MNCNETVPTLEGGVFTCDQEKGHREDYHTDSRLHHTWYGPEHAAAFQATLERCHLKSITDKGVRCRADPKGCDAFEAIPTYFRHNTFNGNQPCDMLVGPCSCGATHSAEEWVLVRVSP